MPGKPDHARRALARSLRLQGHSLSQIASIMGLKSTGGSLARWLQGVPPPHWTRRPRAKDETREKACRLRQEGRSYREIEEILSVSRSSVSLWLRNVPITEEQRAALTERRAATYRRQAESVRAASRARHERLADVATAQIQPLTEKELFLAGVIAYWAEGSKIKPWGQRGGLSFINSDPGMIRLFLAWIRLLGIPIHDLTFRVHIHESADVTAAERFWAGVVGIPPEQFRRPTLKRHNPRTVRKNVGPRYVGCLIIRVRKSTDLNTKITGWFRGILDNLPEQQGEES